MSAYAAKRGGPSLRKVRPFCCGCRLLDDLLDNNGGGAGAGLGLRRANRDHNGLGGDRRGERNRHVDLHDSGDQGGGGAGVCHNGVDTADGDADREDGTLERGEDGRNDDAVDAAGSGLTFAGHIDDDDVTALLGVGEAVDRQILIEDGAWASARSEEHTSELQSLTNL